MEQINTFTQQSHNGGGMMTQASGVNQDVEKMQLKEMIADFMNTPEMIRRTRLMVNGPGATKSQRLNMNIDEVRQFHPRLANFITNDPLAAIKTFQEQLAQNVKNLDEDHMNQKMNGGQGNEKTAAAQDNFPKKTTIYYVNFEGNFGQRHITPRGLKSDLMNQLVQVSGIVTRMSIVRPILHESVHYCEETKRGHVFKYDDHNDLDFLARNVEEGADNNNKGTAFKTSDNQGHALSAEHGYCIYKDQQTIVIQEMPERTPPGQLPRSIEVILESDLVDKCKPGDRVSITGVFRSRLNPQRSHAITKNFLIATGMQQLNYEREKPNLTEQDIRSIKKLSKDEKVFDIIGNSIGSSISGLSNIKKALLLLLLGGAEKTLETGTHLRGDINILMVGDPSTAKSQLLRHIMDIAPLAINTTGRGSTGVGLTAAVTIDKDTGEKHLEAGAMVLADRGVVCIDEFDKMNDLDRVAIHEVMEQQTVTIAKAGIHVSLNSRCSVIAAANPIYGEYARDLPVGKNIGMPDSLLSRFDLMFVVLDEKDADSDRIIAERVIANHRYLNPDQQRDFASTFHFTGEDVVVEKDFQQDKKSITQNKGDSVFEKQLSAAKDSSPIVTRDFLKKYIAYAKSQRQPELHQEAVEMASLFYATLRTQALQYDPNRVSVPITVRTLESIIRLATAHAKLRLAKHVEMVDIEMAGSLVSESIFQEYNNDKRKPQREELKHEEEAVYNDQKQMQYDKKKQQLGNALRKRDADGDVHMEEEAATNNKSNQLSREERLARRHNIQQSPKKENQQPNGIKTRQQQAPLIGCATYMNAFIDKKPQLVPPTKDEGAPVKRQKVTVQDKNQEVEVPEDDASHLKELFNPKATPTRAPHKQALQVPTSPAPAINSQLTPSKVQPYAPAGYTDVTMDHKKYVFRLINENKLPSSDQVTINSLWKGIMMLPDSETHKKGKPIVQDKGHLVHILKSMDDEQLIMYSAEDGNIIII